MASGMLSPRLKIAQKSTPSANAAGGIHLGRSGPNLGALRSLSKGLFGSNRFVPKEQRLLKQAEVFAVSNITSAPVKKEPEGEATCVLVGDIGGTNARLSLWNILSNGNASLVFQKWYKTSDYRDAGFISVLESLVAEESFTASPPSSACFAIAGNVENGVGSMTNLGWLIDGAKIEKQFGWRVAVINDFEALGYGIPLLEDDDLLVLNDVPAVDKAPIAVLGPGTGLGEAQLMYDEGMQQYKVWPSEGSHSDFAPRGEEQTALMNWVTDGLGYCEVEHVACGSGLERIYTFLSAGDKISASEPPVLKASEISKSGLNGEDALASQALDTMLSILGAEAGHMSLRNLARGGVYLAGGITPKVIERIKTGVVLDNFLHTEDHRFHSFFKSIRLSAVLNEEVGLIGARHYATQLLSTK